MNAPRPAPPVRYAGIYAALLKNSLAREMAFKTNFLLWIAVEVLCKAMGTPFEVTGAMHLQEGPAKRVWQSAVRGSGKASTVLRLEAPAKSIDYAVMEKTSAAVVVPLDAGWSDVGSWSALQDSLPADGAGNVARGDVVTEDTEGCYLYSSERLIATVGLKDTVVVETKDAVLVAPKSRVQDVKTLVARLKEAERSEPSLHREVFRPWGSYDSVDQGERFQVKRLVVNPEATLSLQMHHHRAEHWIVVSGTAEITCDDRVFLLSENQSTFIPVGAKHRIRNPGRVPLHIIEVQSGSYLGEDDIVRFEDNYGRQGTNT